MENENFDPSKPMIVPDSLPGQETTDPIEWLQKTVDRLTERFMDFAEDVNLAANRTASISDKIDKALANLAANQTRLSSLRKTNRETR